MTLTLAMPSLLLSQELQPTEGAEEASPFETPPSEPPPSETGATLEWQEPDLPALPSPSRTLSTETPLPAIASPEEQQISPTDPLTPITPSAEVPLPPADSTATAVPPAEPKNYNTVMLQGLNKVTARASPIEAPLGEVVRFGNLEIVARSCWRSADARPENATLLEVWELKPEEAPARIFMGWMFASSPSLSALEHPVYDLTVLNCEDKELKEE